MCYRLIVQIANGVDVLPTHSTNSEWCGCVAMDYRLIVQIANGVDVLQWTNDCIL